MAVGHTHREGGPVCRFRTKRECDEFMRRVAHFHPNEPCQMWLAPGWKPKRRKDGTPSVQSETCKLEPVRKEAYLAALKASLLERTMCIACEYGGPHHRGPGCERTAVAVERVG